MKTKEQFHPSASHPAAFKPKPPGNSPGPVLNGMPAPDPPPDPAINGGAPGVPVPGPATTPGSPATPDARADTATVAMPSSSASPDACADTATAAMPGSSASPDAHADTATAAGPSAAAEQRAGAELAEIAKHYRIENPDAIRGFLAHEEGFCEILCEGAAEISRRKHVLGLGLRYFGRRDDDSDGLMILLDTDYGKSDYRRRDKLVIKAIRKLLEPFPIEYGDYLRMDYAPEQDRIIDPTAYTAAPGPYASAQERASAELADIARLYKLENPDAIRGFLAREEGFCAILCQLAPGLARRKHVLGLRLGYNDLYRDGLGILKILLDTDYKKSEFLLKDKLVIRLYSRLFAALPFRYVDSLDIDCA